MVSWSQADADFVAKRPGSAEMIGGNPLAFLTAATGPLAESVGRVEIRPGEIEEPHLWRVKRLDDGRYATTEILFFGQEDVDPDGYSDFIDEGQRRLADRLPGVGALVGVRR
jgi:hypothetical protein